MLSTQEIKTSAAQYRATGCGYAIWFKKQVVESFHASRMTPAAFAKESGIARPTLYRWVEQSKAGLFSLEAAIAVSQPVKNASLNVIAILEGELDIVQEKLELARRAQELGLSISLQ